MIQTLDEIALSGPARNGEVQRRVQDQLSLLERRQLTKVAQAMKTPRSKLRGIKEVASP